jgi:hypothetical protein
MNSCKRSEGHGVSLVDFVRAFDTKVETLEGIEPKGKGSRARSRIKS